MKQTAGYFIVEASAMPEIFRKVAEAKRLLETGEETTVNRAAQAVGISRSAYYKYKDAVRPFNDMLHGRIVTFQTMLKDEPGILSGLLNVFAGTGVNILTINQNIPVNGCAVVTITAETSALRRSLEELLAAAGGQSCTVHSNEPSTEEPEPGAPEEPSEPGTDDPALPPDPENSGGDGALINPDTGVPYGY